MSKQIFSIEDIDSDIIVLKVNCNSTLDAAKHPYVSMNDDYISLTRGKDHLMSIIHKDGSSTNFHFGRRGHTIIGKDLEMLKSKVLDFLHENNILIGYQHEPLYAANVFYNSNYKQWELTLEMTKGDNVYYFSNTAKNADEMIEECKPFVEADEWNFGKAQTGIDIWRAENPTFNIVDTEIKVLEQTKQQEKKKTDIERE